MESNLRNDSANILANNEVVISGVSGVFPKSDNVKEFMENLYNKVNMVTSDDSGWSTIDLDTPIHTGKISNINKFDAQFFKITFQLGCRLEPMSRKLLEHAYAAIFDSGTNPMELKGKNIGIFIGTTYTDVSTFNTHDVGRKSAFVINGGSKAMLANRISYWIDGKGPSYALDYSDAGSIACLEHAYKCIKAGECDAALVGGCNLCVFPNLTANMRKAGLLCMDGKTKCFDKNADGYVRSDAVGLVFLQKAKDAKRIYAEVCHVKGIYGLHDNAAFLPIRNTEDIESFLKDFYSEININPNEIEYVEAQGTALPEADKNEMTAIGKVFGNDRPVKIGCVKSNMGSSDAASGICALTKLCLLYQTGEIPANLHYSEPQQVRAVQEGKVKIVSENATFHRGYSTLNNFSITGANFHVLLKGRYKPKDLTKYKTAIPHLVLASGRQESAVNLVFDQLKSNKIDPEQVGLLHNIFSKDIPGHTGRGYAILGTNEKEETVALGQSVEYYSGTRRPLWFVYSGMGSQWVTMGADLMKIPIFADAIHKCNSVLKSEGIDLIHVLTTQDETVFDNPLHAFVGIGAVQIGLTDILKEMGIEPDNIIGHSLGEIACGYQDGSLTKEELILVTYNRGKACLNAKLDRGAMAAVGVGYKDIVNKCPPEIDIACHNSSTSATISGPADEMEQFIDKLTKQGVFAKEVQSGNVAYHSRYIAKCGPELLTRLKAVLPNPKPRSKRWLSTSVPEDKWDDPLATFSSAEYYTNNLLQPVLFEEASRMIPDNAIVVEIAPHGLLQAILKRSHSNCTHIPLTKRKCGDGVNFLLSAIGSLYINGLNPKVEVLYPKIEYPVSTETQLLSHFVGWEHSEDWPMYSYETKTKITAQARNVVMSVFDDDYKYLEDHVIQGKNVLPEAALIVLIWETISIYKDIDYQHQFVVFKDIKFHSQVLIIKEKPLKLYIMINKGSNKFEVVKDDQIVVSGVVSDTKVVKFYHDYEQTNDEFDEILLTSDDIYRILNLRGYNYRREFQSIQSSNLNFNKMRVKWTSNWVTFLDSLLQMNNLARNHSGISVPKYIRKLKINVLEQEKTESAIIDGVACYKAEYNDMLGIIKCAGVEIDNIQYDDNSVVEYIPDMIEKQLFYPNYTIEPVDIKTTLQIYFQIITENINTDNLQVIPFLTVQSYGIYDMIQEFCTNNSLIDCDIKIDLAKEIHNGLLTEDNANKTNVVIFENLLSDEKKIYNLQRTLTRDEFVIAIEQSVPKLNSTVWDYFTIISSMSNGKQILILMKKIETISDIIYIPIKFDANFGWVTQVYGELNTTKRVVLISERQPYCGLIGFVKTLRKRGCKKLCLIVIDDIHAPIFSPNNDVYKEQLQKNLAINIYKKGQWGGYYYTRANKTKIIKSVSLTCMRPGDLSSLNWIETPVSANDNIVQVYFAGLSLKDSRKAGGDIINDDNYYGMDFSGIDAHGDRVMGVIPSGALSSIVKSDPQLLWPVPEHWSMEEAATVPLPYLQAYYCLIIRSQLKRNQSVLITGGAGALGQAVITLCLSLDCTVYAAVSNLYKKTFLHRVFPQLTDDQVGYLQEDSFLSFVKNSSKGGCDFVINCSSGSMRQVAIKFVGRMGCFLDFNFYDIKNNHNIGMSFLEGDKSYNTIDVSNIFRTENAKDKEILYTAICEGIKRGIVRPLTRITYAAKEIKNALELLSLNKNIGRVLVRLRDAVTMKEGFDVIPRLNYSSFGVHIVVCDESGIGVELADRLVQRGARKIALNMKQSDVNGYVNAKFESWMKKGVRIKLSTDDLSTNKSCTTLLSETSKIGSIEAIFLIQETSKEKVTQENKEQFNKEFIHFGMVVNNMDLFTRNHKIRCFVTIVNKSHSVSERYSSSVAEGICQRRREIGLPALLININENIVTKKDKFLCPVKLTELFNSMEIGIKQNYGSIRSLNLNKDTNSEFFTKVLCILGLNKIKDLDGNCQLNELKLNETTLEQLKCLINITYSIDYTIEKIQHMTIDSFKTIGEIFMQKNTDFNSKMAAFYRAIDNECDYVAETEPIVLMPTLLNNGTETHLDPNATYLTMIPGFEGQHKIFNSIAERLKIQAVSVELGPDLYNEYSLKSMAYDVRQYMKTKFITQSKFYLLGYSLGVNIALEVAAILESEGHIGVVYCLDSSPDVLKYQIKAYIGNISEKQLENVVVEHVFTLIAGQRSKVLCEQLDSLDSFEEKIEVFLKELKDVASFSNEYKRCVVETAFKRMKSALEYKCDLKLSSEIILIRGIPHPNAIGISEDYNLSQYTTKPVKVFDIESDHVMAPYDCGVSNIVNKMLDQHFIDEFKKKNLCDVYLCDES